MESCIDSVKNKSIVFLKNKHALNDAHVFMYQDDLLIHIFEPNDMVNTYSSINVYLIVYYSRRLLVFTSKFENMDELKHLKIYIKNVLSGMMYKYVYIHTHPYICTYIYMTKK